LKHIDVQITFNAKAAGKNSLPPFHTQTDDKTKNARRISPIGEYGRMRKQYLAEHRPVLYESLILNGTLWDHLSEIEKSCNERMEHLTAQIVKNEGVTESLKAADQMEWVRRMNNIRHRAEETVLHELVYD